MKRNSQYVLIIFVLASMLLGACAGAAPSVAGGGKVEASSVAYTGTIESINGTQWVVNGQTITVDPSVAGNGTFNVGDVVKVEVKVAQDGTLTLTSVEIPSQTDLSDLPGLGDDNSNDANDNDANGNDVNGNDVNGNDANGNDVNGNDDNSNNSNGNDGNTNDGNGNDDNSNNDNSDDGNEVFGVVDAITETSITIGGQTYDFLTNAEVKDLVQAGDFVKIHLVQNADGTFSVRELELSDPTQAGNDNSNDDNGNNGNSNDDDDDDDDDENENDDDDDDNSNANDNGNSNGNGNNNGNG